MLVIVVAACDRGHVSPHPEKEKPIKLITFLFFARLLLFFKSWLVNGKTT
jgi:hypothetical protein